MSSRENSVTPGRLTADQRRFLDRLLGDAPTDGGPVVPVADRAHTELSSAQQRLWFFDRLHPGSPLYIMAGVARIRGELDTDALRRSLDEVVRRHEVLRTTLHGDGEPWARVRDAEPVPMALADLSALSEQDREDMAREQLTSWARKPFDLTNDPLLRSGLIRLAPDEHLLLLAMHHIAADGWSLGVLLAELSRLYTAFHQGTPSRLPELAVQYSDYAVWQRKRLHDPAHAGLLRRCTEQLAGVTPLDLPTDHERGRTETFGGDTVEFELPAALVEAVKRFADQERATPYMVLSATFAAVLSRWSGERDVLLGCAVAGRNRTEIEPLIGFFVNTLPLRIDVGGDPSFRELVARARRVCTDAYAWQDVQFEEIVEAVAPHRDPGARVPLVRHILVLHNSPRPTIELPGLDVTVLPLRTGTAKFELQIELSPTPAGGLTVAMEYASELFDQSTVRRLGVGLRRLLADGIARPDAVIGALDLMTDGDRHAVVGPWAGTGSTASSDVCAHHLVEQAADRTPTAPAIVHGDTVLTYADLDRRANRLANHLLSSGVAREAAIGVHLRRSADAIVAMLAVLKAGGAVLPLDPADPDGRLVRLIAGSAVRCVITASTAPASVTTVRMDDETGWSASDERPAVAVQPGGTALILHRSGPTGPQTEVIEHAPLVHWIRWTQQAYQLDPREAVLQQTPLGLAAAAWEWLWPLAVGAPTVIAENTDPATLARLIGEHTVTTCRFTPSALRTFLPNAAGCGSVLRRIICAGDAGDEPVAALVHSVRNVLPGVALHHHHGTETSPDVATWTAPAGELGGEIPRAPIGTPVPGARLYVLDPASRPVPPGVPGELFVGGAPVSGGVPDPFNDGGRRRRTWEKVRWRSGGTLELLGRLDGQVRVGARLVDPAEVEAVLATHPVVDQVAVVPYEQAPGDLRLAAYVSPRPDALAGLGAHDETVHRWRKAFDTTYQSATPADPAFDTAGWTDSFTRRPILALEMREWVRETVDRIAALRPSRILEIGCGTGLLLQRLAPQCAEYVGTDISTRALAGLRAQVAGLGLAGIELVERPADDFTGWADGHFDTVVLNSVCQYFPDADYLMSVLRGALSVVRPGGHVFVGDVRDLRLLDELHLSVQLHRLPPNTTVRNLVRLAEHQVRQEEELVVHPAFFQTVSGVSGVTVLAKSSPYRNELSRFRYDVILTVGAVPAEDTGVWRPWPGASAAFEPDGRPYGWRAVADERLREDLRAVQMARAADPAMAAAALRGAIAAGSGTGAEIAVLAADADAAGWRMFPHLSAEPGVLDVEFRPAGQPLPTTALPQAGRGPLANDPARAGQVRAAELQLHEHVSGMLPASLAPTSFAVLRQWPSHPDGTLDRAALPAPEGRPPAPTTGFVAPRTEHERAVAAVWQEALHIERVGVFDDFFALGGHSLMAIELVGRLQSMFGRELSIRDFMWSPTVAAVAEALDRQQARTFTPIRRVERRRISSDSAPSAGDPA